MSAYLVGIQTVVDNDALNQYVKAALPSMKAYGAKPLAVDPNTVKLEGNREPPGSRCVIIEFESRKHLLAWYDSDEYKSAMALRDGALDGDALIAEGLPTK